MLTYDKHNEIYDNFLVFFFLKRLCHRRMRPKQREETKILKTVENTKCRPRFYLDYRKTMVPLWLSGGKNIPLSSSLLAVIVLWYHQLKTSVSWQTVIGIITLFPCCYKEYTVGNHCFLIDSSPLNNNKITTQRPCKWLQTTAISKRYSTSLLNNQGTLILVKEISNEQMRHFFL